MVPGRFSGQAYIVPENLCRRVTDLVEIPPRVRLSVPFLLMAFDPEEFPLYWREANLVPDIDQQIKRRL
jgi:hypothetical protein